MASKLKEEFEAKEKLAQSQMAKSRKIIALLQSELADVNSKKASERAVLETEVSSLKEKFGEAQRLKEALEEELTDLEAEMLRSAQQKDAELQQVKEELQAALERLSSRPPIPKSGDVLGSLSSFHHMRSPMQSVSTVPMVALEEGLYEHHDSQALMSSADFIGDDQFPSSIEQSLISMDPAPLGSPLQSCPLSVDGSLLDMKQIAPQSTLSMLAVSRLSHHSAMTQVSC